MGEFGGIPLGVRSPTTTLVFQSSDPIPLVRERIQAEVGEPIAFRFGWPFAAKHKFFSGDVWEGGFRLYLIIDHRNTYLPVAHGHFEPNANGTRVVIRLRSNPIGLMVNTIWTIDWGTVLIFTLARQGLEITSQTGWWVPLAMITFVWIMMIPAELNEELEYKRRFSKVVSGEGASVDRGRPTI